MPLSAFLSLSGRLAAALPGLLALLFAASAAQAQPAGRSLGVGAQVGEPTGIAVRFYDRPGRAYDLLLDVDFDGDDFFAAGHRAWERSLSETPPVRLFHGPGLFAGTSAEDGFAGVTYSGGLSVPFERLDAFLQFTPRLRLLPDTNFVLGGGVGLRYFFSI